MYDHERTLVSDLSGKPFALVGVNHGDELEHIKKAAKEKNLNWRSFFTGDDMESFAEYDIQGFPTVMILDADGVVRATGHGPQEKVIDQLLSEM